MKKFLAIALAAIMLFALAACGGNGTQEEKELVKLIDIQLSSEEYAFGVDKAQPELLEDVNKFIEKILKDGTFDAICNKYLGDGTPEGVTSAQADATKDQLIVATNAEFAPFEYLEGDLYYGIDMEVAALLAKELGKELVIENMDFDAVCLAVGQHKCDIAIAGLSINPDREESVTFTTPYYKSAQKIIVKADDTRFDACQTAEDIEAILDAPIDAFDTYLTSDPVCGHFSVFELGSDIGKLSFENIRATIDKEKHPMSYFMQIGAKTVRIGDREIFDPTLGGNVKEISLSGIYINGKALTEADFDKYICEINFENIYGDGKSSSSGKIEKIKLK